MTSAVWGMPGRVSRRQVLPAATLSLDAMAREVISESERRAVGNAKERNERERPTNWQVQRGGGKAWPDTDSDYAYLREVVMEPVGQHESTHRVMHFSTQRLTSIAKMAGALNLEDFVQIC